MRQQVGGVARATAILMGAFVLSRMLGLVREAVLAAQFGTNPDYGAYLSAFRVPDFLFNVIGAGAIGSAFIPVFAATLTQGENEDAWRLASAIMNLLAVGLVVAGVVAALFAPEITRLFIVPGYPPEEQALTASLVRIMTLSPILFGLSGLMMAILNSHQQFFLPALAPILYNLAIIASALVLAPLGFGVNGLAAGTVLGAALHLGVQLPGLWRVPSAYYATWGLADAATRRVAVLLGPRVLGMAAVQLNFIVNVNLASRLPEGPTRVAALSYAWMMLMLPQGVFAQSVATAVFPTFTAQVARGEHDALRQTLGNLLRLSLFISLPASVGLFMLRVPLLQLLFERGEFTPESTQLTAYALQFYALGLVAHSVIEIITRAYYALQDTLTPVLLAVGAMALNIGLSLLLIGSLGHGGLALANSVASTVEMIILIEVLRRRLGGIEGRQLGPALLKTGAATALMALALAVTLRVLPPLPGAIVAIVGMIVGGAVFVGTAFGLRVPEMELVRRMLVRFAPALRRRAPGGERQHP